MFKVDATEEIAIHPEKTCALIIGLNEYPKLGAGYRLENAAGEATEFAGWLLKLGVAADRIKLFVSGGGDADLRDCAGTLLVPQAPTGKAIRDAILCPPFATATPDSLLLVYWAGHGATDNAQNQLLWDQDYDRRQDRLVFDLNDVRQALRSENWKCFTRQILLVNACATHFDGEVSRHEFKGLALQDQLRRKQFTICAALPGNYAHDGSVERTSPFFRRVLELFQQHSPNGRSFSIQKIQKICQEICRQLCDEAGARIEWINWEGCRFVWSGDALARLVYAKARKCCGDFDQLASLYRECVECPEPVESVREILAHLEAEKSGRRTTRHGLVLDFALHLIHRHRLEELDQELTALFEKEAGFEVPVLNKARRIIGEEYRQPVGPLYFSIIPGDAGDGLRFYLHDSTQWRIAYEDVRVAENETLESAFGRIVLRHEQTWSKLAGSLRFHFFLRVENLSLELHRWKDPTRLDDKKYLENFQPVALRCWERARGEWGGAAGRWRKKADALKRRNATRLRIKWLDPAAECEFADATDEHEAAGFHAPPTAELLRDALDEGLPCLFWPRQASANWQACRERIDGIPLNGDWPGLPDHFPRIRRAHRESPFAVFWDDPDHNLYAEETKARVSVPFTDMA